MEPHFVATVDETVGADTVLGIIAVSILILGLGRLSTLRAITGLRRDWDVLPVMAMASLLALGLGVLHVLGSAEGAASVVGLGAVYAAVRWGRLGGDRSREPERALAGRHTEREEETSPR